MRRLRIRKTIVRMIVLAVLLVLALVVAGQAGVPSELRIASWNLEHLKHSDGGAESAEPVTTTRRSRAGWK